MVDLRDTAAKVNALDVEVALVLQADARESRDFVQLYRWPFRTFCDPGREAYGAYGLQRASLTEMASPAVAMAGAQAALRGHFVGRPVGDTFQMPGLFVVDTAGLVRYAHAFRHVGDHPTARQLLEIVPRVLGGE